MCTLTGLVLAGRIGIALGITSHHGLDDLGPGGGSGIMIKIYRFHLFDVFLDNYPASKSFTPFSGRPLDGLGSFAMQTSIVFWVVLAVLAMATTLN
jgi:hypothetical protein